VIDEFLPRQGVSIEKHVVSVVGHVISVVGHAVSNAPTRRRHNCTAKSPVLRPRN
jgi:hypothetical protein